MAPQGTASQPPAFSQPPASRGSFLEQPSRSKQQQQQHLQQQLVLQQQGQLVLQRLEGLASNGDLPDWRAGVCRQLAVDISAKRGGGPGRADATAAALFVVVERAGGRKGSLTRARQAVQRAGGPPGKWGLEGELNSLLQHWQVGAVAAAARLGGLVHCSVGSVDVNAL
jgi:hypothetical protein